VSELLQRLARVRATIAAAAARAGRSPNDVELLAVTKRHPTAVIREAIAAGLSHFGENFAQELAAKHADIGGDVHWHFIGKVQRNKVKMVVGLVDLIHAVDSERLADEIDKRAAAAGLCQDILISVNVTGEQTKSGVSVADTPALLSHVRNLSHVRCTGFMTMPPLMDDPELNRPHFAALVALRDRLATGDSPLAVLSMGTSGDYAVAVEEGATLVRVGTAIFGPRSYTQA